MSIPSESKEALDKLLSSAVQAKDVPGIVYAAIDKKGAFIYEGAAGAVSLGKPEQKVILLSSLYRSSDFSTGS